MSSAARPSVRPRHALRRRRQQGSPPQAARMPSGQAAWSSSAEGVRDACACGPPRHRVAAGRQRPRCCRSALKKMALFLAVVSSAAPKRLSLAVPRQPRWPVRGADRPQVVAGQLGDPQHTVVCHLVRRRACSHTCDAGLSNPRCGEARWLTAGCGQARGDGLHHSLAPHPARQG